MATIRDYTLAQIASTAFLDNPTGLPGGLAPLTASDLGVVIDNPAESFANGIYRFGNAAALVGTGILGGQERAERERDKLSERVVTLGSTRRTAGWEARHRRGRVDTRSTDG